MRPDATRLRSKAEGKGDVELFQRGHQPVEPGIGFGSEAVGPTEAGPEIAHPEPAQPAYCVLEARVFEVKPLTDTEGGGVLGKVRGGRFGSTILPHEAEIEVTIVGRSFGLPVPSGSWPGPRQVEQAIPVNSRRPADQELRGTLKAELLNLVGAKGGNPYFGDPHRQGGNGMDLSELVGPLVDGPMIPVEREAMHGHGIHMVEHSQFLQGPDEAGIDR